MAKDSMEALEELPSRKPLSRERPFSLLSETFFREKRFSLSSEQAISLPPSVERDSSFFLEKARS